LKIYFTVKRAVKKWLLRALQPCCEMAALMSESLERRLTLTEFLKLRLHLLVCAWCARYFAQIKFLRWMMHQNPSPTSPSVAPLSAEARDRITKALGGRYRDCR